jgi:PEP-CTERM motif
MRIAALSLLTILCLALSAPAFAGDLYNNGPTNGTSDAYYIDSFIVTDSFVVFGGHITSFDIGLWTPAGATPLAVNWMIGTLPYGNNVGNGGGTWTSLTMLCSAGSFFNGGTCGGGFGYDVYEATMNTGSLPVSGSQTYWLTLTGATNTSTFGNLDAWDINSGPSLAYNNLLGAVPSESFTINGGPIRGAATPEPSSILLFGSGTLGLAGLLRRKLRR